ncbi:hypothetical protein HYZ06_00510 [Candidatus Daviesbacteria bacterium]|nr:hypothetical protein [Candidatus Daviesbacteria bacterium]
MRAEVDPNSLGVNPQQAESAYVMASDDLVLSILRNRVEAVKRAVEQPFRLGLLDLQQVRNSRELFYMSTESEYSFLEIGARELGYILPPTRNRIRIERGRYQELAFQVMERFGFDPNHFRPSFIGEGWNSAGVVQLDNGTSREILDFPSTTIPGLAFERWLEFYTGTGQPIYVGWSVIDNGPRWRINLARLFPRISVQHLGLRPRG